MLKTVSSARDHAVELSSPAWSRAELTALPNPLAGVFEGGLLLRGKGGKMGRRTGYP